MRPSRGAFDNFRMRGFAALLLVVGLGACHAVTPQEESQEACTTLCKCVAGALPGDQQACMSQCMPQLSTVSEACLTCTFDNADSCPLVIQDCVNICLQVATPKGGL